MRVFPFQPLELRSALESLKDPSGPPAVILRGLPLESLSSQDRIESEAAEQGSEAEKTFTLLVPSFREGFYCLFCAAQDLQKLEDALGLRKIRLSSEHLKCFRLALASFEGTHFFGNFANKKLDPRGPQGFRHVRRPQEQRQLNLQILRLFFGRRRVHCGNPWVDEHGREWVTVEICADSFLTHQIRKMIATAALVAQGALSHLDVKTQRFPPNGLIFKRPFFKSKTSTGLPSSVEAKLNSEEVAARMFAMQEWLQKEVIKEAEEGLSAVYWLACVAHFAGASDCHSNF
eukprot:g31592.t1